MNGYDDVDLLGMSIARLDRWQLLDLLFDALDEGRGLWVVTANLDFIGRHARDPEIRALYDEADIRVADGMPLVWASHLQRKPLPERVAGSSLVWLLAERAAARARSMYLLGGSPESLEGCKEALVARNPTLDVCGMSAPWVSTKATPEELADTIEELERLSPDILLVGLGSPKQEWVIHVLRERFPKTAMIGVGITFSFVAGMIRRAPPVLRRWGLEWVHRLAQEPRRLGRRYLVDGPPIAVQMLLHSAKRGLGGEL